MADDDMMTVDEALAFVAGARQSYDKTEAGDPLGRWQGLYAEDLLRAAEAMAARALEADELGRVMAEALRACGVRMIPYRLRDRLGALLDLAGLTPSAPSPDDAPGPAPRAEPDSPPPAGESD